MMMMIVFVDDGDWVSNITVRWLGLLPPNTMRPEAELVRCAEAAGNRDPIILLRLATVVVLHSFCDGRAHLLVLAPIRPPASTAAIMGQRILRTCLELVLPPATVVSTFRPQFWWDDDGRATLPQ